MPETLYGLRYDWEMRNGHYLLLSRDVPLDRDDLVPLEEKMLTNVAVPRLLPLEFEEVDLSVKLRYRLPAVRSLKHFTRTQPLDANMILKLLYGIASIIDDSKTYMLNEEKYLLQQDYIWIGQDVSDIHLAYVPLKKLEGKPSLQQELLRLSQELFEQAGLPLNGYRKVFDHVKGPLFQIPQWKKILLSHFSEHDIPLAEQADISRNQQALPPLAPVVPDAGSAIQSQAGSSGKRSLHPPFYRRSLLLYAFVILLAAVWTSAAAVPSEGAMLIATGFTLLLGDGVYYKWKRTSAVNGTGEEAISIVTELPSVKEEISQPLHPLSAETYMPENQTVFLQTPGETVLLSPYMFEDEGTASLEAVRGESCEKAIIRSDSYLIGRNAETVHWVEDAVGVSRIHMEILRKQRSWLAKDLGSKNGSRLNGEVMEPFREYELKDGDRLGIASSEFFFRRQDKKMNH